MNRNPVPTATIHRPARRFRTATSVLVAAATLVVVAACTPAGTGTGGGGSTTTTTAPSGVTVSGSPCTGASGVTVVVDFTALVDEVVVGCAPGAQATGFDALHAAGFTTSSESGPGTICRISGLPSQGYPYCWLTGGDWSYWKTTVGGTWTYSTAGAGSGPLAAGAVEGWSWAPGLAAAAPRVSTTTFTG